MWNILNHILIGSLLETQWAHQQFTKSNFLWFIISLYILSKKNIYFGTVEYYLFLCIIESIISLSLFSCACSCRDFIVERWDKIILLLLWSGCSVLLVFSLWKNICLLNSSAAVSHHNFSIWIFSTPPRKFPTVDWNVIVNLKKLLSLTILCLKTD